MRFTILSLLSIVFNGTFIVAFRIHNNIQKIRLNSSPVSMSSGNRILSLFSKSNFMKTLSTFGLISSLNLGAISPALALPGSVEDANNKLATYNLPPVLFVPPGFSTVVSEYGRGSIKETMRNPLLVKFQRPQLWVTATTTVNNNGEAGTISANDYIKGDSAFFFTIPQDKSLDVISKDELKSFILKSLSQKGDPVDAFKINAVRTSEDKTTGKTYYLVDISYILNTQAGFAIDRKGVASVTSVGPAIEGLITLSTAKRYKNLESDLRTIADSFRVYQLNSGIFTIKESDD